MDPAIASTLLAVGTALMLGLTVFKIVPAIGRARFVREIAAIRDAVDDAVITGDLPDAPVVRDFIRRTDVLQKSAPKMSLSFMLAAHALHREYGRLPRREYPTYAHLSPSQRAFMHKQERAVRDAVQRRLLDGSSMALPLRIAMHVIPERKLAREANRHSVRPAKLAKEWRAATPHLAAAPKREHHSNNRGKPQHV